MKHALIVGPRLVGKTTLINKVLEELDLPAYGFQTKKEASLTNEKKEAPTYIYELGKPKSQSKENLVGYCNPMKGSTTISGVFNNFAPKIMEPISGAGIILFDEIGFMEAKEEKFCKAILSRLDGDIPVIAAVKDKAGYEFLEKIKNHPKCRCFYITEENRDELFSEVLNFLLKQIKSTDRL
ncbi:MAG: hypothetical protein GX219_01555 [Tissierellia bacterium]|nr:hypothetical protein [Tissierellia bacterium]